MSGMKIPSIFNKMAVYRQPSSPTPPTPPGPDYQNMPFTISALQNADIQFSDGQINASNLIYTKTSNGVVTSGSCGSTISLDAGDIISFEGPSGQTSYSDKLYAFSVSNGNIAMYGNIGSIIGYDRIVRQFNFHTMFQNQTNIVDVSNLYFNFDVIEYRGCHDMFSGCKGIQTPPHFLAHTYNYGACWATVVNCSLTAGCQFPITGTVGEIAFAAQYISNPIVNANFAIPSNLYLNTKAFVDYFSNVTTLQRGPLIGGNYTFNSSSTGSNGPFCNFYYHCSNLSAIQVQFTSWNSNYFRNWVNGVNSNGLFIVPQDWQGGTSRGSNAIPTNFTMLKRMNSDHSLRYYQTDEAYTGEDPYAWYYGT